MAEANTPSEAPTPPMAILLVFATGVLFSCLDTSAKYLVLSGMSAQFVAWARFAEHFVLAVILLRAWQNPLVYRAQSLWLQILRGIFLFGSTFFNFLALKTLQLAETTSIFFFAPMLITALAGPLLGEWAGWRRWLAIAVAFVRRAGDHTAGLRPVRAGACLRHDGDDQLQPLCADDPPHGGIRNAGKPDLLFGACAGFVHVAGGALHRVLA